MLAAVAGWALRRWLRVATSPERYRLRWRRRELRGGELCYVALGDSLTQGIGASDPELGFAGLLAARLEATTGKRVRVLNLAGTGVMLRDVLSHQLPRLHALPRKPDLVTVTIGTNDAGRVPPAELRSLVEQLCQELPDGALVADLPAFHRGRRRRDAARDASKIIREVLARHPRLAHVALDEPTRDLGLAYRCADLFHPNNRGHRLYADAFWAACGRH
jgi:acyl-CoA thioesterase I